MVTNLILQLRILPRWIIIVIDITLVVISTLLGYLLRFNFNIDELIRRDFLIGVVINSSSVLVSVVLTKSYAGIVRYTGIGDGVRLFKTLIISLFIVSGINLIYFYNFSKNIIPYSVILISFLAAFLFLFQYRLLIKNIFSYYRRNVLGKTKVAIFGAGQLGIVTKQVLDGNDQSNYKVEAFFEDDATKIKKEIDGTQILDINNELEATLQSLEISEIIIAIHNLPFERKNELVDTCLKLGIKVLTVPPVEDWVHGELSLKQIKEIKIEDLLGRELIQLDNHEISNGLAGKCVCITGAAGSIGSELVRQVARYNPRLMILVDQAESGLYDLEKEMEDHKIGRFINLYVADIRDKGRMSEIFDIEKPEVIFHAAAYKHVPLMESNPLEAVRCNIEGTKNLADLAYEFNVSKFIMISTDKAVNPTSVMGCSKRIAEIYIQSLNNHIKSNQLSQTTFVITRFGNVLGSNGSVIPLFKKQIANGGPIKVTHPEITRYFMTITEACQLVLEASTMGKGGEVFIFDMGESMKILDLAKKMIKLSGLEINKDIEIVFTGLRQGEKLYEELLANSENTVPTHHNKIMIARVSEYNYSDVNDRIEQLLLYPKSAHSNHYDLVRMMKEIVPEYISNNSDYDVIDTDLNNDKEIVSTSNLTK